MSTLEAQNNTFYVIRHDDNMFIAVEEEKAILKYKELSKLVTNDNYPKITTLSLKGKEWTLDPMTPNYIVNRIIALGD